jgi:hypothetical protein
MALDPIISRGVTPIDASNTLLTIARMKQVDRAEDRLQTRNDIMDKRYDRAEGRAVDAESKAAALEEMKLLYPLVKAGDEAAIKTAIGRIAERNPAAAEVLLRDPTRLAPAMAAQLGITPEKPGQLYEVVGPDGKPRMARAEQAEGLAPYDKPQQFAPTRPPGPSEAERLWQFRQSLSPADREEFDRSRRAPPAPPNPRAEVDPFTGRVIGWASPPAGDAPAPAAPIGSSARTNAVSRGGPVRVRTREEALALPSGTVFITPAGQLKTRP